MTDASVLCPSRPMSRATLRPLTRAGTARPPTRARTARPKTALQDRFERLHRSLYADPGFGTWDGFALPPLPTPVAIAGHVAQANARVAERAVSERAAVLAKKAADKELAAKAASEDAPAVPKVGERWRAALDKYESFQETKLLKWKNVMLKLEQRKKRIMLAKPRPAAAACYANVSTAFPSTISMFAATSFPSVRARPVTRRKRSNRPTASGMQGKDDAVTTATNVSGGEDLASFLAPFANKATAAASTPPAHTESSHAPATQSSVSGGARYSDDESVAYNDSSIMSDSDDDLW